MDQRIEREPVSLAFRIGQLVLLVLFLAILGEVFAAGGPWFGQQMPMAAIYSTRLALIGYLVYWSVKAMRDPIRFDATYRNVVRFMMVLHVGAVLFALLGALYLWP